MPLVLLFLFGLTVSSWADAVRLDDSVSPNRNWYVSITPSTDGYMYTSNTLQIRRTDNNEVRGTFEWGQYGPIISSRSATVLWKSDSKAFALTWNQAHGWMGSDLYVTTGSNWTHLTFPNILQGVYIGRGGWTGAGKGCLVVVEWMPNDLIKTDFTDRLDWHGQGGAPVLGDDGEDDWAYFELSRNATKPALKLMRLIAKTPAESQARYEELIRRPY